MLQCWEMDPTDRPTFSDLVGSITSFKTSQESECSVAPLPDTAPSESTEPNEVVLHQSCLNMVGPTNYYLEIEGEDSYLKPMEECMQHDDVIIELDTRPTDPNENEDTALPNDSENQLLMTMEDIPVDYVNENVQKFRTNTSSI